MDVPATLKPVAPPAGGATGAIDFLRRVFNGDRFAYGLVFAASACVVLLTILLAYELWIHSALSRTEFGWSFLFKTTWDPIAGEFGALPFMYGTVVTTVLALLFAIPLGIGAAIFLAELAPPRISDIMTFLIELLAAVPSVIIGLLGIFIVLPILQKIVPPLKSVLGFLPIFSGPFYGVSVFSAGVVLTFMILPFIITISREVLLAVPRELREAALALGATRWESTWQVVIPFARTGIIGSIFLAMARALGETMAVTMVIGNSPKIMASLLAPGYSIASVIANEFTEATGDLYLSALIELGLVLFFLTVVINGLARLLITLTARKGAE
jgi:phosphate transport system permease protein